MRTIDTATFIAELDAARPHDPIAGRQLSIREPQDHHFTGPPQCQQPENNGSCFHDEGRILFRFANYTAGRDILELGADIGISSRYILEGCYHNPNLPKLHSVDCLHKWPADNSWPLREIYHCRTTQFRAPPGITFDWSFIDADHQHSAVVSDIYLCQSLNIPRLIFHDCHPRFADLPCDSPSSGSRARGAVLEVLGSDPTWDLTYITTPCGLIFASKKE